MRLAFLSLLLIAVGSACGSATPSVIPVAGPDGQSGWMQVSCPRDPRKCRELAAETCPDGYNTEDFRLGSASRYASPSAMDEPMGPPDKNDQMLITCKSGPPVRILP